MLGMSLSLGGGACLYIGNQCHTWSWDARQHCQTIESAPSAESALMRSTPRLGDAPRYAVVTGRLAAFDGQVLQSKLGESAIRVHRTSFTETDRKRKVNGTWTSTRSKELVASSQAGGLVAIELFGASQCRVVLPDKSLYEKLLVPGDESFVPGGSVSVNVNTTNVGTATDQVVDQLLGIRNIEKIIPAGKTVAVVGLFEPKLLTAAAGSPKLEWALLPPSSQDGRPSLAVYGGDRGDLVRAQAKQANFLGGLGIFFSTLGSVAIVGGLFSLRNDLQQRDKK